MRVIFALYPGCEILDLAGPMQAFHEARNFGADYELLNCAATPSIDTAQGLTLGVLAPLPTLSGNELIVIPGFDMNQSAPRAELTAWVRAAYNVGARICSVCTGAFILGAAGILDGRRCTTHWKRLDELRKRFPAARVVEDALYTIDDRVICSAGIASGIDMALALIETDCGPRIAAKVAREMVVYIRRDGHQPQLSVYFDYRSHPDNGVHAVQDHILADPQGHASLEELAKVARMSSRSLTRAFRAATGISIVDYRQRVRLQNAANLLDSSSLSIEAIAGKCGFRDASHLRKMWRAAFGTLPSQRRKGLPGRGQTA